MVPATADDRFRLSRWSLVGAKGVGACHLKTKQMELIQMSRKKRASKRDARRKHGNCGIVASRTSWGPTAGMVKKKHTPGYLKQAKW